MMRMSRLAALALIVIASPGFAQTTGAVDDRTLAELTASLARYVEAREAGEGLAESRAAVEAELANVAKAQGLEHALEAAPALGRAAYLARDFTKTKLKNGKVTNAETPAGTFAGGRLEYAYRVPRDYAPEETSYPLVLAIPGAEQRPDQHIQEDWSSPEFRDGAIVVSPAMPGEFAAWDKVAIDGRPGGLCHVLTVLRIAESQFAVDPDRIFVTGRGPGVPAAVATGDYSPHRFAGIIGRAGDAGELAPHNFGNLPTCFFGAGTLAQEFRAAALELGFDNCTIDPTGSEADAWRWLSSRSRNPRPTKVSLVVGKPFPTRSYWLRVSPIAPDARATASIERESNTIRVDGSGVSHVTLYLDDRLVDLDQPLTILRNGVREVVTARRSLPVALDLLHDGTSDPASVFVAEVVTDVGADSTSVPVAGPLAADPDYEARLAASLGDPTALWQLHLWCVESGSAARARSTLAKLLRLEPDHAQARAALGHERAGEQWFTSTDALERFRRSQDEATAQARGYVRHKGLWVHPDDRAALGKGLLKDHESGRWLSAADRRRLAEGWVLQDTNWIEPAEASRVDDGEWWVDGEWLSLAEANRRHARIERMWRIPTADVLLHTTVDRHVAQRMVPHMSRAIDDLRRVFGNEPTLPLEVVMLRDEEQYDLFAFGDPDGRRPARHAGRLHVIHTAFFAESWFERVARANRFAGMGVGYWNADVPHGDLYGVHSARLAVGFSFVEALDPSPNAVRSVLSKGPSADGYATYEAEKRLPAWFRYGAAVYAERYFEDDTVAPDGDRWWARKWSLANLRDRGGLRPLDELFALSLDPNDRDDGLKLLIEAGTLVAFLVDGGCAPAALELAHLQEALRTGRLHANHVEALQAALRAQEPALRAFATVE